MGEVTLEAEAEEVVGGIEVAEEEAEAATETGVEEEEVVVATEETEVETEMATETGAVTETGETTETGEKEVETEVEETVVAFPGQVEIGTSTKQCGCFLFSS